MVLLAAAPIFGWTRETHLEIAKYAATIAPPDLFRQIKKHEQAFVKGLTAPLSKAEHGNADSSLTAAVGAETHRISKAIESLTPFRVVVEDLGRLAQMAAEANNPLTVFDSDPMEPRYRIDYDRYVGSAFARFEVVFYGDGRDVKDQEDVGAMLAQVAERGLTLYPMVELEYQRVGKVDGIREFDDRSTAFGVGALAFSHAVSDVAALFRYVWLSSGGADPRDLPITSPRRSQTVESR